MRFHNYAAVKGLLNYWNSTECRCLIQGMHQIFTKCYGMLKAKSWNVTECRSGNN